MRKVEAAGEREKGRADKRGGEDEGRKIWRGEEVNKGREEEGGWKRDVQEGRRVEECGEKGRGGRREEDMERRSERTKGGGGGLGGSGRG